MIGDLLGDKDAGSGGIQILRVDTVDLVASTEVRRLRTKGVVFVGQTDIQTAHIADRDGTLGAALLQGPSRRRHEHIVTVVSGVEIGRRPT